MADSAYDVIKKYHRGEITRDTMIRILGTWPFPLEGPRALGSIEATVGRALDEGLITSVDYDEIVERLDDAGNVFTGPEQDS